MLTAATGIMVGLVVVLLITALTGYFVAQEFAYMAVDRSRLKARSEAGDAAAARALSITRRTSFMLSGAQLGITVTGLLVGYVAEPLIGRGLGESARRSRFPTAVGGRRRSGVAVLFSTLVQMLFGELFPKNLAIARPEPVAAGSRVSTTIYLTLFGWLIWFFDAVVQPVAAGVADRAGARRRAFGYRRATSSTSSPPPARPAKSPRTCRPCSTGSWTSPPAPPNTR